MTVTTATDRFPWVTKLAPLAEKVYAADSAWYADLDNAELKAAYKAAKKDFRDAEAKAMAAGASEPCHRCGGAGGWQGWPGFTCFNCGGSGKDPLRQVKFPAEPSRRAKREAEWQAKVDAQTAAFETAIAALGDVGVALAAAQAEVHAWEQAAEYGPDEPARPSRETYFRASLATKLYKYGSLSDAQVAAAEKGLAKEKADAEMKAEAGPLAEGTYELVGEIVSHKWSEDRGYGSQHKMLVRLDNGNKVFGTIPESLEQAHQTETDQGTAYTDPKGSRVSFTATVERSRDDDHFGFFKRPRKATLLSLGEEG